MARFKARSPNKPAPSSIILEGSGVPTGVVVAKLELHGVTRARLPSEFSVNAMKMVPAGSPPGSVTVCGLVVHVPILRSETLKLIAAIPVAPDSWLIALFRFGNTDPPVTPSTDQRVVPLLFQLPVRSAIGLRTAKNSESLVGFPLRNAVVVLPLIGITLLALQPVLTSQRCILSALTAPEKTLQSANIKAPVRIFLVIISPVL
jgi:hypothetical protein